MKKLLPILGILLLMNTMFAQNKQADVPLKLKFTTPKKDKQRFTGLAFHTKDENGGFIIGRLHKNGYYIEHYNKSLKLIKKYDFVIKKDGFADIGSIDNAYVNDGKLYLIEYVESRKNKVGFTMKPSKINEISIFQILFGK